MFFIIFNLIYLISFIQQLIDILVSKIILMPKKSVFRAWFYFRIGWGTYFTFIFTAINSLVVTYYLAIEKISVLEQIFPSVFHYGIIIITVIIPSLTLMGYIYFKKSPQFSSEADINFESNPHWNRMLINTDISLSTHSQILENLIKKYSQQDTLNDSKQFHKFKNALEDHAKRRTIT